MYYFGKDFIEEKEIQSLLEDYLKKKKEKEKTQKQCIQN